MMSDLLTGLAYLAAAGLLWRLAHSLAGHTRLLRMSSLLMGLGGLANFLRISAHWLPHPLLSTVLEPLTAGTTLAAVALACRCRLTVPASRQQELTPRDAPEPDRYLNSILEMHKRTTEELQTLSLAIEHSSSMVLITDNAGRIEYCNPAFCSITGYMEQEVLGRRMSVLKSDETNPDTFQELWNTLAHGQPWQGEILERKKSGENFWCLKYFTPMRGDAGKIKHFVVVSHDVTELKKSEETLRRLAYYDSLTQLPNRTLFRELLDETQSRAQRDGGRFAVIYFDVDRFKNINDSLGHDEGNQLLVAVSQRLRQCLREKDTVARLAGDEFAILLPEIEHPKVAGAAATAIQDTLNQPFEIGGYELFITASLGISIYPDDHQEVDQLLKMADAAMSQAKEFGRNQYQYYHQIPRVVKADHFSLENWLRFAVERGELEVYYQPKFELESGHCHTAEALLRWRHPDQGMVSPGRFIPIAEQTGLIDVIGEWALRTVCRQIRRWQAEGLDMAVAVNLSARQFRRKSLLETIDGIIEEFGIDCSRLEFEITESAVMNDPKQTAEILRAMKQRGLTLSIDDFGTGYSSLSYLKMFPIDILKIDQSFVRDIGKATGDPRIVKAVIAMAHSLDLAVVAEGIETQEQVNFLKRMNCDMGQGYFYSRPVPAQELAKLLRAKTQGDPVATAR